MHSLNDAQLAEIRQRAEKASPGSWECVSAKWPDAEEAIESDVTVFLGFKTEGKTVSQADARFFSSVKKDIPALLATVDALRGALEGVLNAASRYPFNAEYADGCMNCATCLQTARDALAALKGGQA